ncbi:MAG: A24 family peptidase [Puniceicoccales bacterium]|jgi:leader peptidase (prepilin peptidase)/N-methyltransferase|nr:A24 family peptidase [Puniceicoccales bacterium]
MHWIHYGALLLFLTAAAVCDSRDGHIPDIINYCGIAVGLLSACFADGLINAVLDVLLISGGMFWLAMIFESLTHREGMGFGDVKLSGVLGAYLGVADSMRVITYAAWLAVLCEILRKNFSRRRQIPFAPYILGGATIHEICSLLTSHRC